jgi:hypothetical protein
VSVLRSIRPNCARRPCRPHGEQVKERC